MQKTIVIILTALKNDFKKMKALLNATKSINKSEIGKIFFKITFLSQKGFIEHQNDLMAKRVFFFFQFTQK